MDLLPREQEAHTCRRQMYVGCKLPDSIRFDGKSNYVIQNPGKKRRHCAYESCTSVGCTACSKCDVGL